jgi:hypothetical protein
MDDKTRRELELEDARRTVERVSSSLSDRDETVIRREVHTVGYEPGSWRRNVATQEPPKREPGLDTAPIDWSAEIDCRVASMREFVMDVLGEALNQSFAIERNAHAAAMHERDAKIGKLELELVQLAASHAKLEVRLLQALADGDHTKAIELPSWPRAKGMN